MPPIDQVQSFTWVDWAIVLVVFLGGVNGISHGFVRGTTNLLGLAVAFAVTLVAAGPLTPVVAAIPGFPPQLAPAITLLAVFVVARIVFGLLVGQLIRPFNSTQPARPLIAADRGLGVIPGIANGVLMAGLLVLPFALGLLPGVMSPVIERSVLGTPLLETASRLQPVVDRALGPVLEPSPSVTIGDPQQRIELEPGPLGPLAVDEQAEATMLDLINTERAGAGLRILVLNTALREAARAHSREMFEQRYFAHDSPTTGTPADRLRRAGARFLLAGENLAYAPTVQVAHQGLMASPGHRANILRPEFGRVGIGVIRSALRGSMFTQEFAD